MNYSSNGLYLGGYVDGRALSDQLKQQRECKHETCDWLPPDFRPDVYRCRQCGVYLSWDDIERSRAA